MLQVRLGLADGRKLDLEGEVRFVREKSATTGRQPSGCGVRLRGLPGWAVDAIDRFASARQPIVYAPRADAGRRAVGWPASGAVRPRAVVRVERPSPRSCPGW